MNINLKKHFSYKKCKLTFLVLGGLQGPNEKSRKAGPLLDPGYDAVDKKAPFATGKTDGNHVDLPGPLGRIEYYRGVGLGIG